MSWYREQLLKAPEWPPGKQVKINSCIERELWGTHLTVHVVFSFNQLPTVHLASVGLTGDDVSLCFVQDLDGYADGHVSTLLLKTVLEEFRKECHKFCTNCSHT